MAPTLISVRGDGPWMGRTTRNLSDTGKRYQERIVNGYVSGDGSEIRSFPGFRTLIDLTAANNETNGFRRQVFDVAKPVTAFTGTYNYDFLFGGSPGTQLTMKCCADEAHIHAFEQVRDTVVLIGESLHRKIPIYTSARVAVAITTVAFTAGLDWRLGLDGDVTGGYTASDTLSGLHALEPGDIIYVENVTLIEATPEVTQAMVDAALNGRFHKAKAIGADFLTLTSSMTGATATAVPSTVVGDIWRTRNNASETYPTPNAITPWEPSIYHRIDDPMALTTWTVREPLSLSDPASRKCIPAWVANRQRDMDDELDANPHDGVRMPGLSPGIARAWSRRQQRSLPYRVNPDVAGDRLVIAAPGYLCCFQAPISIPLEPEDWPSPPADWSEASGKGVLWFGNDIYDKPRCLGVPKGVLIDSLVKTCVSPAGTGNPSPATRPYDFLSYYNVQGASLLFTPTNFAAGTYKVAISYVDEVTGEEGLASEPVSVTITAGLGIRLIIMHPGYIMPESLCRRVNVYLAPPGTAALGYYTSLTLQNELTGEFGGGTNSFSAKYGSAAGTSPEIGDLWRFVSLPHYGSPLQNAIDYTRLAPQSGQQPRGAEAIRVINGIVFTVGHSGTHGNAGELLRSLMSASYSKTNVSFGCLSPDEVQVQDFYYGLVIQSTPVSPGAEASVDGPFLVGGHRLPASYQGIEVYTRELVPVPRNRFVIEAVKNNVTHNTASPFLQEPNQRQLALTQRLRTVDPIRDVVGSGDQSRRGKEVFLVLPRGQVQVGDPGRPGAVASTAIQFMDAKKDDDGFAIGQLNNSAIFCSKRETYSLSYNRVPAGNTPQLVSLEHGCIATNSMVPFDGGCAWIGARGPVAMGGDGVSWIGEQIEDDFHGDNARYALDSKGVMRCCWGAHDASRGLVLWGLVTKTSTHQVSYKGITATYANATDEAKSRFPCDEIVVWSYRANAFSTWVPPSGLEVLWMRPLKLGDGSTRMCFLAADKRIYALDDAWADTNEEAFAPEATNAGTDATVLLIDEQWSIDGINGATGRVDGTLLRVGMPVVFVRDGKVLGEPTTIASLDIASDQITLADESTWEVGDKVEFGHRPTLTIRTTYVGDTDDVLAVKGLHLRYTLIGSGNAHAEASVKVTNLNLTAPQDVGLTESPRYIPLAAGDPTTQFDRVGQRRIFEEGCPEGAELSLALTVRGCAGIRISDVLLEVGG